MPGASMDQENYIRPANGVFVLVHGAWQGGWVYRKVARLLRERGHDVYTPTLTGVGERSHLADYPINLSTHIHDIMNVIQWEELDRIVLCGHSYGGQVITGVADAMAERIAALVYLDAIIPVNGLSVVQRVAKARENLSSIAGQVIAAAEDSAASGLLASMPPQPARTFNVNPADCEMVDRLSRPQPLATFVEPLRLSGAVDNISRKIAVLATGWAASTARQYYEDLPDKTGWELVEVPEGHNVMLDAPEVVVAILENAMPRPIDRG